MPRRARTTGADAGSFRGAATNRTGLENEPHPHSSGLAMTFFQDSGAHPHRRIFRKRPAAPLPNAVDVWQIQRAYTQEILNAVSAAPDADPREVAAG